MPVDIVDRFYDEEIYRGSEVVKIPIFSELRMTASQIINAGMYVEWRARSLHDNSLMTYPSACGDEWERAVLQAIQSSLLPATT